jgi:predicted DNA-binding transcriptional regulator YafY
MPGTSPGMTELVAMTACLRTSRALECLVQGGLVARAERLLDLIQVLRRHRRPVSGQTLADELGISLRTVYRDIQTLIGQGAAIDGEAGIGFILRPGFVLPPLMFSEEEVEALVLGSRWVADRADARLAIAARDALAKIAAVLPAEFRNDLETSALLVGPGAPIGAGDAELLAIRRAIRSERKLAITYLDLKERSSSRTIWPFALAFFDRARVVVAWCEMRQAFRHFRTDRITALTAAEERYPRRRQALMKEWREAQGFAAQ